MPGTAIINTATSVNVVGTDKYITTQYFDPLPNTIFAFIATVNGEMNCVPYTIGDLVVTFSSDQQISWYINTNGELIVVDIDGDEFVSNYSIDNLGNLIYTPTP
jgi:hypothetical protein